MIKLEITYTYTVTLSHAHTQHNVPGTFLDVTTISVRKIKDGISCYTLHNTPGSSSKHLCFLRSVLHRKGSILLISPPPPSSPRPLLFHLKHSLLPVLSPLLGSSFPSHPFPPSSLTPFYLFFLLTPFPWSEKISIVRNYCTLLGLRRMLF